MIVGFSVIKGLQVQRKGEVYILHVNCTQVSFDKQYYFVIEAARTEIEFTSRLRNYAGIQKIIFVRQRYVD